MNKIREINRKTFQYWWIDGLVEMVFSIEMILLALLYEGIIRSQVEFLKVMLLGLGLPLLILGFSIVGGKIVRWLKERITYPRTGYVSYKKGKSRKATVIVAVSVSIITVFIVNYVLFNYGKNLLWVLVSVLVSISTIIQAYRFNVPRFYILAVLQILLGTIITFGSEKLTITEATLFLGGLGIIWFISGIFHFLSYIRQNPVIADEEEA